MTLSWRRGPCVVVSRWEGAAVCGWFTKASQSHLHMNLQSSEVEWTFQVEGTTCANMRRGGRKWCVCKSLHHLSCSVHAAGPGSTRWSWKGKKKKKRQITDDLIYSNGHGEPMQDVGQQHVWSLSVSQKSAMRIDASPMVVGTGEFVGTVINSIEWGWTLVL